MHNNSRLCFFFFFKQKTAYEITTGDWSSDVCSSDLAVALGHRRIGAILGPSNTSTAQSREVALRAALAEQGLTLDPQYVRRGPFDTQSGDEATTSLLALPAPPTLIFCGNDVVAYGALNAARRAE